MSLNENSILKPRTDFDDCYVYGDEIGKYVYIIIIIIMTLKSNLN